MLLVDDESEPEIPVREEVFQTRPRNQSIKQVNNSVEKKRSLDRHIKSLERKKSTEHGVNLPLIGSKKTQFK